MRKRILPAIIIFIAISGSIYWFYTNKDDNKLIEASGTIEAVSAKIVTPLAGRITVLNFEEGGFVEKDFIVSELERNDLLSQYERDAINVEIAAAKLYDIKSGARNQEIEVARLGVSLAETALNDALVELERTQTLFNENAISKQQLDKMITLSKLKEDELKIAQTKLNLLLDGSRHYTITSAEGELERAKAILSLSESLLLDTKIKAPIDGIVLTKLYEEGEFVPAGATLGTIADTTNLWVKVFIANDDLPYIALGQKVDVSVSGSQKMYTGTITHIATQGEFTPKTIQTKQERTNIVYAIKVSIDNPDSSLKPGMPADISIERSI